MAAITSAMKADGLIFDVGLHKGEDTDFYLKKGFRVVAFEADPQHAADCRKRFSSAIDAGKFTVVEGAIVPAEKLQAGQTTITFYKNTANSVWGTIDAEWAARNAKQGAASESITVPVVNFAQCLVDHGVPYYLKLDIEGADTACLRFLHSAPAKPSYVSMESELKDFGRLTEEINLLSSLGYTHFKAIQQQNIETQRPPQPAKEGAYVAYRFEPGSSGLFGEETPGPWLDKAGILSAYEDIFRLYRMFGNDSWMRKYGVTRFGIRVLQKLRGAPLPGWYDTHARHGSVTGKTA